MLKAKFKIKENLTVKVTKKATGKVKIYKYENLVVSSGLAGLASRINGDGAEAAFTYIALGTNNTAASAGQTALVAETSASGLARAAATASRVTTTVANDTAKLLHEFTAGASATIVETAVFNAGAVGTMLARRVITAVPLEIGDKIELDWRFACSTS